MRQNQNDPDLLTRSLQLIEAFHSRGQLATREVQQILDLDRQKARRTIKRLQEAGLPIEPEGQGNATSWVLNDHYRQTRLRLGFGDVISLELGHQLLGFLEGTDLSTWLDDLRDRTLPMLGQKDGAKLARLSQKLYYQTEPYRKYAAQDELLNLLLTALFAEHELAISYAPGEEEAQEIARFQPLTLVVYRRALYLLGLEVSEEGSRERLLAVDRIQKVERGLGFAYPLDHQPAATLGHRFGIWKEEAVEQVIIRFAADRAHLVRSRQWHPSQVITDLPDGRVELRMNTGGRELARFVLEWGPKAEVVHPPALREAVAAELRAALAPYESEPVPAVVLLPETPAKPRRGRKKKATSS
jgi:predicted DNA-binding transcriptional regulator YafY